MDLLLIETPIHRVPGETPEERKERRRRAREQARSADRTHRTGTPPPVRRVVIYSGEERDVSQLEVPRQLMYEGTIRAISSIAASTSCSSLGITGLLKELNDVLGTQYALDQPALSPQLQTFVDRGCDFGTAYAHLRPRWYCADFNLVRNELAVCEAEDAGLRRSAVDSEKKQIVKPRIPPRRVWDLCANRVIPIWVTRREPQAVSHSWMSIERRQAVDTPINAYEWPVPIPSDTTLERIRVELLSYEAEYVWLDVLCLRQEGPKDKEELRLAEWGLDVPTIGNVYHQNQMIFHYYSGLGRPFRIGDLSSDRHWLNRAWTLQEISSNSTVAGVAGDSPLSPALDDEGRYVDADVRQFYDSLASLSRYSQELDNIIPVLAAMRHRSATSELDKIAGLAYLLRSPTLPIYIPDQSSEDAWMHLVEAMHGRYRGDLLFLYPSPGDGRYLWCPSWKQIKDTTLPKIGGIYLYEDVRPAPGCYQHRGYFLEGCLITGLGESGAGSDSPRRRGKLMISRGNDTRYDFAIDACHSQAIPNNSYVLVGTEGYEYWVVGRVNDALRIEKVSAVRMVLADERVKFEKLNLGKWLDSQWV
jgi:hypothetical protein